MDALTKQVQQLGINGTKKDSTVAASVKIEEPVLVRAQFTYNGLPLCLSWLKACPFLSSIASTLLWLRVTKSLAV